MRAAQTAWPAPAKLNLFLLVTGRRADGYHELQTLFQLIDLCDTVTINVREDGQIERPLGPPGVPVEADLTVRAAQALRNATGTRLGGSLKVHKRIPLGAGSGGGSSDAATTRLAPARLTGTGSCVFSACGSAGDAERLAARVPDRWVSFVARGLNSSPVHELLEHGRQT